MHAEYGRVANNAFTLLSLQDLVKGGSALAIRMDRLFQASQALDAALHWSAQAEVVDSCGAETPFQERPSLEQVMRPEH